MTGRVADGAPLSVPSVCLYLQSHPPCSLATTSASSPTSAHTLLCNMPPPPELAEDQESSTHSNWWHCSHAYLNTVDSRTDGERLLAPGAGTVTIDLGHVDGTLIKAQRALDRF